MFPYLQLTRNRIFVELSINSKTARHIIVIFHRREQQPTQRLHYFPIWMPQSANNLIGLNGLNALPTKPRAHIANKIITLVAISRY